MKLLHLNVTYSSGSTGSIIRNINRKIKEDNLDIETYVAYSVGNLSDDGYKFINRFEYFIVRAARKLFCKSLFGLYFPTKKLIRYIKKVNPDILHLHTIHHQVLNYKMLFDFLKKFEGRVIYTLHDCWPFTGGCYYYSDNGCSAFRKGCMVCKAKPNEIDCKPSNIEREFEYKKEALTSIPRITFAAVSDWLAKEAKNSFLKESHIITVHNGIDSNTFHPMKFDKDGILTVISVASHWESRKHLDYLLELSTELADVRFLVVGDVNPSIEKTKYPNVVFCGKTKNAEELCRLYNSADVFANFSTEETFGLVTAEAMSCGLPVVAFNRTACGEIVSENCGIVVETLDDFKNAIMKLKKSNLSEYKTLCRQEVLKYYTTEKMADKYISLYTGKGMYDIVQE